MGSTTAFSAEPESSFQTQRAPGSTFVFGVQGDSHPEREKTMFNGALYTQTLRAMAAEQPDFYVTSGDDFSVDTLPTPYTQPAVTGRYTLQLPYFSNVARSAALFLTTGNHEETSLSNYNLPADSANSNQVPIWAQNAHNFYYPSPSPDAFYSGNTTSLPNIGLLRAPMAIYNAWCDRVPMLLIGAVGPVDAAQLRVWLQQKRVDSRTPVFVAGAADWTFVGLLPEFSPGPSSPPPTIAPLFVSR